MIGLRRLVVALVAAVVVTAAEQTSPQTQEAARKLETSLVDAPSVKLHVTFKRKSMNVHGHSEFDVFADPVVLTDGEKVLYDGYATFVENKEELTYMFTNGAFYVVESSVDNDDETDREPTVRCLPAALPFDAILPALNDITPIPSASIGGEAVNCSSGNLFKTTFSGANFAVCASGASGFTAHSSDMTIEVTYLANPISISEPELTEGASSCAATAKPTTVTPTALALMTGDDIPESTSRYLKAAEHMVMEAATCECNSTPRPCVFFHGLGNANEDSELQDTNSNFGYSKIQGHTPCCTVVKYANLNTVDYGWTNDTLQEKFCKHALSIGSSSSDVIEDTIIVTHSMGGLMMAGAIASGKCSLGSSSTWVALSPPMTGSMSSDYIQDFCNDEINDAITDLMIGNRCPASAAVKSTSYQNEKYSSSLDAAYEAAQAVYREHVSAAICSTSYIGNISKYQAKYMLAGAKFPHKSNKNDGLVEFHSCLGGLPESQFNKSYFAPFYRAELNHADTAFKTGDGVFKQTVRPVKWFECLL